MNKYQIILLSLFFLLALVIGFNIGAFCATYVITHSV
jgi:hypothetical protein